MPRLKVKPVANKARGNTQPLVTCHYPQPYFCNNPYLDPQGKIGPTYISPKGKLNKSRGIFMPTGPGKWVCIIILLFCANQYKFQTIFHLHLMFGLL